MANEASNLTLEGGWRYLCTDVEQFRNQLSAKKQNYSTVALALGLTRERIRQFAGGTYVDPAYLEAIMTFLGVDETKPEVIGFKKIWARRRPKVVKRWIEGGRKRPQKELLTSSELAEFLGYGDYKSKSQLISNWVTNAGLPLHSKGGDGDRENIFAWDEVEAWLAGFPGSGEF